MCKIVKLTGTYLKGDYLCNKYLKVIYLCNNLYLLIAHGKKPQFLILGWTTEDGQFQKGCIFKLVRYLLSPNFTFIYITFILEHSLTQMNSLKCTAMQCGIMKPNK